QNAGEQLQFWQSQSNFSRSVVQVLREVAAAQREATLAERGSIQGVITAQEGDSWESLARRAYRDASRAGDIRQANGVTDGSQPITGTAYIVPR
ncbi:MAG TPA: hypothetical protein VK524_19775, partial [Polyangiaceae bacterium]|nr:hypothetical protein [Polyangiaceae bacterium]